jgi:hypothetical protein
VIVASAIKIDGQVFVGKRHVDAAKAAMEILGLEKISYRDDGFITSDLKFLNREEALIYAKEHNQYKREELARLSGCTNPTILKELFSEDLW